MEDALGKGKGKIQEETEGGVGLECSHEGWAEPVWSSKARGPFRTVPGGARLL